MDRDALFDLFTRALRAAEWGWRDEGNNPSCPVCQRADYEGHLADCVMGEAMRELEPERSA